MSESDWRGIWMQLPEIDTRVLRQILTEQLGFTVASTHADMYYRNDGANVIIGPSPRLIRSADDPPPASSPASDPQP